MPGSQLVNRLQDLNFRVQSLADPVQLLGCARADGPMLIFVDLEMADALRIIGQLKSEATTGHIPIVAFGDDGEKLSDTAQAAGATLVVGQTALLNHLPRLLEQALRVE
jgi:PleD family two-component response regulator